MNVSSQSLPPAIFHLTQRDGCARIQPQTPVQFIPISADLENTPAIHIDERVTYQEIVGFGGAFTEAGATTLLKMPAERQEEIIHAYFDLAGGHGYTLCRTHINSCDFSLGNYAYCDQDGDFDLKSFSIQRDRTALLPMIKRALRKSGNEFKLFASPWSPPAWMKTTGQMNKGGKLKPECRDAWARYYARYIREYEKEGVAIWGITVQNEPQFAAPWDACEYTGEEERDFVRDHLGPVLQREGLGEIKIIIWDHNRDQLYDRAKSVFDDPEAAKYVWGAGFHWYARDSFDNVQCVHDAWPDKNLLLTEACQEYGTHDGSWLMGERYARSIIQDLRHWTVGWVDWNMVLDETGGPNHVSNFCSSPILANTQTGEIHYQSSYYYLGHFSRFIRPGAKRILCATTRDELEAVAFENKDGSRVVVVLNRSEETFSCNLKVGNMAARFEVPRRSIQTGVIVATSEG